MTLASYGNRTQGRAYQILLVEWLSSRAVHRARAVTLTATTPRIDLRNRTHMRHGKAYTVLGDLLEQERTHTGS